MDAILTWNDVALEVHRRDFSPDSNGEVRPQQPGPTRTSRALAIVHMAMFDAFAPVGTTRYGTYAMPDDGMGLGGRRAATATAAALTLIALFDRQRDLILSKHQEYLASLPASPAVVNRGVAWGRVVAETTLRSREGDGSERSALLYAPSSEPGQHRPDPQNPGQGVLDPHWGGVRPFIVPGLTTVIPAKAPPLLTSAQYAAHYNEVLAKGAATGSTRTPDETVQGVFWAYDGAHELGVPPRLYNQAVRAISMKRDATEEQNARLFAMVNMAMADAGIQAWHEKYLYNVWRPVVGIREADQGYGPTSGGDGNPSTAGDPGWLPYGSPRSNQAGKVSFTPSFPAYPSGHATFGTVAFLVAQRVLGLPAGFTFEFVSDELNGKTIDNR
ncbi:MAG: Chloride peroxidase, partial [Pseudomonadota bacterium]